ncbi:MAG: DEAD/DEAH box helicase family protein [Bacteroidota bacterium]
MPDPFASVRFSGLWRPYQARVLAELDAHLDDERVHVVAPPGSGKTLLGLEAVVRMGRPALVLAPTLALRDQWLSRFREHFGAGASGEGPVAEAASGGVAASMDLAAPEALTVTTYQALHVAHTADPGPLAEALRAADIGTLVVDEAHHLRKAWWKTLHEVREALPRVHVVALTATPPYDVPGAEWNRYRAFCGPPDAEITTPELVRAGHLCPHTDAVHLSTPLATEQAALDAFHAEAAAFAERVARGPVADALARHPWIADAAAHAEAIADEGPEWFVAALGLVRETGRDVTDAAAVFDLTPEALPPLRMSTLSRVLDGILGPQAEAFAVLMGADAVRDLGAELRRMGAMIGSHVVLHRPPAVQASLGRSASKIEAVAEIVAFEAEHRGTDLRAVVLTDRIHEEAWAPEHSAQPPLGVSPILSRLRRLDAAPVAALTGRFVALPAESLAALRREVQASGARDNLDGRLMSEPLAGMPGMVRITLDGAGTGLVGPMTRLFASGEVRVLVGTVALLGEGWDAPEANVLVAASYAATFVQTGQMRGRVLRLDPAQSDKVGTIWHLACVEPGAEDGGPDLARLHRRFAAFAGPRDADPPRLETGLERLGLPAMPLASGDVAAANARTYEAAVSLARVRRFWRDAVGHEADGRRLRPVLRIPRERDPIPPRIEIRQRPWTSTFPTGWAAGAAAFAVAGTGGLGVAPLVAYALWVGSLGLGGTAAVLAVLDRVGRQRHAEAVGETGLRLEAVGEVVLSALRTADLVDARGARVAVERVGDRLDVRLDGSTVSEAETFSEALVDLVGAVGSPRYLLDCEGAFVPVPAVLGRKKALAEAFRGAWDDRIGPADLVFTRTPAGRQPLAAAQARGAWGLDAVEHVRQWA